MLRPETRYARSGDVHIAYQVVGDGPFDIVFVQGFISNLEVHWEDPGLSHLFNRLGSISRFIVFDKRGSGLSDRVNDMPDLETRMDDVRAVMDAAGSREAALVGASEGGPMSILFAATYPQRTRALILYGAYSNKKPRADCAARIKGRRGWPAFAGHDEYRFHPGGPPAMTALRRRATCFAVL
jgi:pimeloyl-ACP methyl ester carboxylesterase